jgi:hypothetical protein
MGIGYFVLAGLALAFLLPIAIRAPSQETGLGKFSCAAPDTSGAHADGSEKYYDFDHDGCRDYARLDGEQYKNAMHISFGTRSDRARHPDTFVWQGNPGYSGWYYWPDIDNNGMLDFCYILTGGHPYTMQCQEIGEAGGGVQRDLGRIDRGYGGTGRWVSAQGSAKPQFCRSVGYLPDAHEECIELTNWKFPISPDDPSGTIIELWHGSADLPGLFCSKGDGVPPFAHVAAQTFDARITVPVGGGQAMAARIKDDLHQCANLAFGTGILVAIQSGGTAAVSSSKAVFVACVADKLPSEPEAAVGQVTVSSGSVCHW